MDHLKKMQSRLENLFGKTGVLFDPVETVKYALDWTTLYKPNASAVVFPTHLDQLVELVQIATIENIALVPSGGRTGLVGGAVATNAEVVVSFEKMNRVLTHNEFDATITCEPGVSTQTLQETAKAHGFYYPIDLSARGSCQVGGNIATNAGGLHVIRYGSTRNWVSGLKVVTGDGELLNLNRGLIKNATGYDLRQLFIGSEGTLGFIVEATMQLTCAPQNTQVILFNLRHIECMLPLMQHLRSKLNLMAVEFFSDISIQEVMQRHRLSRPIAKTDYYMLVEFESDDVTQEQAMLGVYEHANHQQWIVDAVISQNEQQKTQLWKYREMITETIAHYHPYKQDVSVLTSHVVEFITTLEKILLEQFPGLRPILFGHIGDGNVHVNILPAGDQSEDDFKKQFPKLNECLFSLIAQFQGAIAAEHGVGLLKRDYLKFSRSESELLYMKRVKQAFDPHYIMNPGKLLEPQDRRF